MILLPDPPTPSTPGDRIEEISDAELPGMWETADLIGGWTDSPLPHERLSEIKARLEAATPGSPHHVRYTSNPQMGGGTENIPAWRWENDLPDGRRNGGPGFIKADAELYANAASDIDFLTAQVLLLERERDELREALRTIRYAATQTLTGSNKNSP